MYLCVLLPAVLFVIAGVVVQNLIADVESVSWSPPSISRKYPEYHDVVTNTAKFLPGLNKPEGMLTHDGYLYTGVRDGKIIKASLEDGTTQVFAQVDGHPLGLAYHPQSNSILVCSPGASDKKTGLLAINMETKEVKLLFKKAAGKEMLFVDDVDVDTETGDIYLSDATKVSPGVVGPLVASQLEILGVPSGRVVKYDWKKKPAEGEVLSEGLAFSNGVAVDSKNRKVYVVETGRYRVHQYDIPSGKWNVFVEDLPGFPDGVSLAPDGSGLWVAMFGPRDPVADSILHPFPIFKRILQVAHFLMPPTTPPGGFVHVDNQGKITARYIDETANNLASTTDVVQEGDNIYIGSLAKDFVGRFPLK